MTRCVVPVSFIQSSLFYQILPISNLVITLSLFIWTKIFVIHPPTISWKCSITDSTFGGFVEKYWRRVNFGGGEGVEGGDQIWTCSSSWIPSFPHRIPSFLLGFPSFPPLPLNQIYNHIHTQQRMHLSPIPIHLITWYLFRLEPITKQTTIVLSHVKYQIKSIGWKQETSSEERDIAHFLVTSGFDWLKC